MRLRCTVVRLTGVILLLASGIAAAGTGSRYVEIRTGAGTMLAILYPEKAPRTVANFLHYVDADFYDGGEFVRTVRKGNQPDNPVKIDVVQAFGNPWKAATEADSQQPIPLERTRDTGLQHLNGTLSMARGAPDTATTEFFICIGAQPALDFGGKRNPDGQGFAAFGRVIRGLDVLRRIHQAPADGQALNPPIRILSIHRVSAPTSN